MKTSKCKGCGKEILWGETVEGKKIPLDMKPPVYGIIRRSQDTVEAYRAQDCFVSHFTTCPQANRFSGSKK